MLDNSELILPFVPEVDDGDTFVYTEMLDRGQRKGNNGNRLLKTFYHRSRGEFREQVPVIMKLCDLARVRACTRLAPRSYRSVGRAFTRLAVDTAMSENWAGMKSLYNRACGTTGPIRKLWLIDIDDPADPVVPGIRESLRAQGLLAGELPSKKGLHLITTPFHRVTVPPGVLTRMPDHPTVYVPSGIDVHKDNPTNLYIPDGAD